MLRRALLLALGALSVTGCGQSVPPRSFGNTYAAAYCGKVFRCCSMADQAQVANRWSDVWRGPLDEAHCEEGVGAAVSLNAAAVASAEQNRSVVYHDDRAAACLDTLKGLSCADFAALLNSSAFLPDDPNCNRYVEPNVPPGGVCDHSFECLGHNYCNVAGGSTYGSCIATLPDGSSCQSDLDEECASGHCVRGTCAPIGQNGSPCGKDADCSKGWCNALTCQPTLAPGAHCTQNDSCQFGQCTQAGTCPIYTCDGTGH